MTADQFMWALARVAALSAYASLAIAVLTGIALRTAVLDWLGGNRALRSLHEYTTALWIPLALVHVVTLILDATARVSLIDVFVPFRAPYGTLAIGLGTVSLDLLLVVALTSLARRRMRGDVWRWIHRLAYVAFALVFLHALLGGTDFGDPVVAAITWGATAALAMLAMARLFLGRLPA
jgi:sulfoxide reductase heme-binding subunit YedZ